jgi:hypothetical protein
MPAPRLCPFALARRGAGIGGEVVDGAGEVLDEVVDDALDGEDADRAAVLDDGQVAVAAVLHVADGDGDGVLQLHDDRVGGHALGHRRGEGELGGEDAAEEIAFGEDADDASAVADQDAADGFVAHDGDGIGDRVLGFHVPGRRGVQARHALDLQGPSQIHRLVSPFLLPGAWLGHSGHLGRGRQGVRRSEPEGW